MDENEKNDKETNEVSKFFKHRPDSPAIKREIFKDDQPARNRVGHLKAKTHASPLKDRKIARSMRF